MNKFYFLIIFLFVSKIKSLEILWNNTINNLENNTTSLYFSYKTDKYIIAESLKSIISFSDDNIKIIFDNPLNELYSPLYSYPLLVLPFEGSYSLHIKNTEFPLEKIVFNYSIYNLEEKKIMKNNRLEVLPYYLKEKKEIKITEIDKQEEVEATSFFENEEELEESRENELINNLVEDDQSNLNKKELSFFSSISYSFINLLQSSSNPFLIFFIVYFLGILMSLTPCIYPMIPITISILQNNAKKKSLKLHSTAYIFGIGLVFSILGLLAVSGFMTFGGLLGKFWFIVLICFGLSYLAGSMFGYYEVYVPQIDVSFFREGSLISSFLLGAFSGTITSPCVSPGLFTLLTLVGKNGNYITGFFMLFVFGLGLGTPLWIASFIFNSANVLPKAGIWMIEIKKIIGLLIVGVIYNYISPFVPEGLLYFIFGLVLIILANILYPFVNRIDRTNIKIYSIVLHAILIISASFQWYYLYIEYKKKYSSTHHLFMETNFDVAREKALKEEKYLLIDFTADWCASCKALDKNIFSKKIFWENIFNEIIGLSLNCTDLSEENTNFMLQHYKIKSFPTIIIIDPFSDKIVSSYGFSEGEQLDNFESLSPKDAAILIKKSLLNVSK